MNIKVFGKNAKQLLLGAPIKGKTVMGFDPAYRTGCKIAVIDETGKVLDTATVYPTAPQNDVEGAKKTLLKLIKKDETSSYFRDFPASFRGNPLPIGPIRLNFVPSNKKKNCV